MYGSTPLNPPSSFTSAYVPHRVHLFPYHHLPMWSVQCRLLTFHPPLVLSHRLNDTPTKSQIDGVATYHLRHQLSATDNRVEIDAVVATVVVTKNAANTIPFCTPTYRKPECDAEATRRRLTADHVHTR
ncbi:unnamed protein product, partial [Hydatigera taeniaeformis]|uniref:Uncharacterized protein n=1 Tax=Hydatigena taeniaeformis TaxID=6205 RepID=A0A0R3WXK2_HYDTA